MNRLLLTGLALTMGALTPACTYTKISSEKFSVGGVPRWLADGAKLDSEPEPYRPDPAIILHKDESGPLEFKLITDKRKYEAPRLKKTAPTRKHDPLERGRDYRIKRLFR